LCWIEVHVAVFWVVTPCSDVVGYQRFGRPCCIHLQGEVGILPTMSQPRRPRVFTAVRTSNLSYACSLNLLALGPIQPPIQCVPRALSLGVKRLGRDHSPPSSAKVKNAWSCTSNPQYVYKAWCLVQHRDNFTFALPFT